MNASATEYSLTDENSQNGETVTKVVFGLGIGSAAVLTAFKRSAATQTTAATQTASSYAQPKTDPVSLGAGLAFGFFAGAIGVVLYEAATVIVPTPFKHWHAMAGQIVDAVRDGVSDLYCETKMAVSMLTAGSYKSLPRCNAKTSQEETLKP